MSAVTFTREDVREGLKNVYDPEIGINIVDLGLVYDAISNEEGDAEVIMTLTSMGCPMGPQIIADVQNKVGAMEGAGEVRVRIVWSPPWSPAMMSEDARDELGMY